VGAALMAEGLQIGARRSARPTFYRAVGSQSGACALPQILNFKSGMTENVIGDFGIVENDDESSE